MRKTFKSAQTAIGPGLSGKIEIKLNSFEEFYEGQRYINHI